MPTLDFVLPHWAYWLGLAVFPLIAMTMAARTEKRPRGERSSLGVGYLILVTAGFVGLHRFYVRSWLGAAYLLPFVGILYANVQNRLAREGVSAARNDKMVADFELERAEAAIAKGTAGAAETAGELRDQVAALAERLVAETASVETWANVAGGLAGLIGLLLILDALLLPSLVARQKARETDVVETPPAAAPVEADARPPLLRGIEAVSRYSGEYVAYWSVIAVFVYYYEVLARYVFNSPTNWAHESMFLMFGMQYLISGAYAYLNDSHVRVDVFYARMSPRGRAISDLATSAFFFLFAGTMLVTGWVFMMDSMRVWEVSFTEWAIQYWPVKITITLGAALLILQGLGKLAKDIAVVIEGGR